jgi:U11/U12 small nuclear ribonucleoprotein SNRNP65
VFATFASVEDAKRALGRLHQLEVLGSRLVVEYANDKHPHLQGALGSGGRSEENEDALPSPKPVILPPPPPPPAPRLSYSYPPPSLSTLTNITHTLVTIPKFYEQVLHLMNLMNLPPPFGPVTPAPPGLEGGLGGREEERGESEGESEVGSGEDSHPERLVVREVKRRTAHLTSSRGVSPPAKRRHNQPQFDSTSPLQVAGVRKISLHVPSKIQPRPPDVSAVVSTTTINVSSQLPGKSSRDEQEEYEEEKAEEEEEEEKFISSEELARNRLSDREMQEMSVFRGYSPGEPSLRLYIKNLSRQTTEQELRYVYGRYIDWSSERERTV